MGRLVKRRGWLAPRSQRALDALPERARVVDAAFERDRGYCQAERLVPVVRCGGRLDPHEVIPRSAWAGGYLVVSNVLMVCRNHHDWIGDHPDAAHVLGLHGYSWNRPPDLECGHDSATGIDQAPCDALKVWRCDSCGWTYRSIPCRVPAFAERMAPATP